MGVEELVAAPSFAATGRPLANADMARNATSFIVGLACPQLGLHLQRRLAREFVIAFNRLAGAALARSADSNTFPAVHHVARATQLVAARAHDRAALAAMTLDGSLSSYRMQSRTDWRPVRAVSRETNEFHKGTCEVRAAGKTPGRQETARSPRLPLRARADGGATCARALTERPASAGEGKGAHTVEGWLGARLAAFDAAPGRLGSPSGSPSAWATEGSSPSGSPSAL